MEEDGVAASRRRSPEVLSFGWAEFLRFSDELRTVDVTSLAYAARASPVEATARSIALDVFLLGVEALVYGSPARGRVCGTVAEADASLREEALCHRHYMDTAVAILCRLMAATEHDKLPTPVQRRAAVLLMDLLRVVGAIAPRWRYRAITTVFPEASVVSVVQRAVRCEEWMGPRLRVRIMEMCAEMETVEAAAWTWAEEMVRSVSDPIQSVEALVRKIAAEGATSSLLRMYLLVTLSGKDRVDRAFHAMDGYTVFMREGAGEIFSSWLDVCACAILQPPSALHPEILGRLLRGARDAVESEHGHTAVLWIWKIIEAALSNPSFSDFTLVEGLLYTHLPAAAVVTGATTRTCCMIALLEFFMTVVERNGIEAIEEAKTIVTDAFTRLPGDFDSDVSCALLQFLRLTYASVWRERILTEGLPSILAFAREFFPGRLVHLFGLGCDLVRQQRDVTYLFRSVLPKCISTARAWYMDAPDTVTARFLKTWSLAVQHNRNLMSLFSGFWGNFMQRLNQCNTHPKDKWSCLLTVLDVVDQTLEQTMDPALLFAEGVPVAFELCQDSIDGVGAILHHFSRNFIDEPHAPLMTFVKSSLERALEQFNTEEIRPQDIHAMFRVLIERGRIREVRLLHAILFREEAYAEEYQALWKCLLGVRVDPRAPEEAAGGMSIHLLHVMEALMDLERRGGMRARQLASQLREQVVCAVQRNTFGRKEARQVHNELSQLAFVDIVSRRGRARVSHEDQDKGGQLLLPADIFADSGVVSSLMATARRLDATPDERDGALKDLVTSCLHEYLSVHSPDAREQALEAFLSAHPENEKRKHALLACGYAPELWEKDISIVVSVQKAADLDQELKSALLQLYREYVELLEKLNVAHVNIGGKAIEAACLFDPTLSLPELQGRRAVVCRCIERLNASEVVLGRRADLLDKEARLEDTYNAEKARVSLRSTYRIQLLTRFFECARSCGETISGCYAPNGVHAEAPLEIGVRCDRAIVSILDLDRESSGELENAEIIFTEQGALVYQAYGGSRRSRDTSIVWSSFFRQLVECGYVPRVIVPCGHPHSAAFAHLRRFLPTEVSSSLIRYGFDFFDSRTSYFDKRPEKIEADLDVVISSENCTEIEIPSSFRRTSSFSRAGGTRIVPALLERDLAGFLVLSVLKKMDASPDLQPFKVLGRCISQYVCGLLKDGMADRSILDVGLDLGRWNRSFAGRTIPLTPPEKVCLVDRLVHVIGSVSARFFESVDARDLYLGSLSHFFDAVRFLKAATKEETISTETEALLVRVLPREQARSLLTRFCQIVPEHTTTVVINSLTRRTQDAVMRWIFVNEDRVWRTRGGRPGHETVDEFVSFLGDRGSSSYCFPGIVLVDRPPTQDATFALERIVGYVVGECSSTSSVYEVVAAWIDPRFQGQGLAMRLYWELIALLPPACTDLECDVLEGTLERLARASWLARISQFLGVHVLRICTPSYSVELEDGSLEQFQKIRLALAPLRFLRTSVHQVQRANHPMVWMAVTVPLVLVLGLTVRRRWHG